MKHIDDPELRYNLPDWMLEKHPEELEKIAGYANTLVQKEGYSEEQAYEIALERMREEEEPSDLILNSSNINAEPLV